MSDLIDRQKAMDALDRIFDQCEEIDAHLPKGDPDRTGYKMYPDYMTVWKYLHQLPSAEPDVPERNVGKWMFVARCHVVTVISVQTAEQRWRWTIAMANLTVPIIIDRKDIEESLARLVKAYTQQWIPVSERLPEMPGWYLISKVDAVFDAYFSFDEGWEIESIEGFHPVENVIAWMPLPEPYQEVPHAT